MRPHPKVLRTGASSALVWICATVILIAASANCGTGGDESPPTVFAAASLADVLVEAAEAYREGTGQRVDFNFGGSNALANQVAGLSAPADAVIFAGEAPMRLLIEADLVSADEVVTLMRNELVVVAGPDAMDLQQVADLAEAERGRIAIADPALAPAGAYSQAALQATGIWDVVQPRLVATLDVRAVIGAVASGSADYGLVYRTDAMTANGVRAVLSVPAESHPEIIYPAAVINDSPRSARAAEFTEFLRGGSARQILSSHGFITGD